MKKSFILWIIALVILFTACDPYSEANYIISNGSDSLVTIELHKNLSYELHTKDTLVCCNSNEQPSFELLQYEYVKVSYGWMNPTVGEHTPLWKDIVSIKIGNDIISPNSWKENCWLSNKSGGHLFSFGEKWDYTLTVTNDMVK